MRVRNVTKYVRSSPSRMAQFRSYDEKEGIQSNLQPCLDVPTQWNSTYFMLERALVYQKTFERLEEENTLLSLSVREDELGEVDNLDEIYGIVMGDPKDSRKVKGRKKVYGTPNRDDWDMVKLYVKVLKLFHDATECFFGSLYVTCNSFFMDMMLIRKAIVSLCDDQQKELLLRSLALAVKSKFEKYWQLEKINSLLLFGFVLDPRCKFAYVSWCLKQCYEGDVEEMVLKIKKDMARLYDWYEKCCNVLQIKNLGQSCDKVDAYEDDGLDSLEKMKHQFKMHLEEENNMASKSELERYLVEACEVDNSKFDILAWWKVNSAKYPILSQVARDILAILVSTVASKSAFSMGGRVLDLYRTSLSPKVVEALICAQNWLRSPSQLRLKDYMDEVEKLEAELLETSDDSAVIDL